MMKANFYGLRGKQLSLVLVALVCTTILVWTWEKNPIVSNFLPPQHSWLQVSSDIQTSTNVESSVNSQPTKASAEDVSAASAEETETKTENSHAAVAPPLDVSKSTPKTVDVAADSKTSSPEREDALKSPARGEMTGKDSVESPKGSHALIRSTVPESVANYSEISREDHSEGRLGEHSSAPASSALVNSTGSGKDELKVSAVNKGQACNYAEGKWVVDERRPLYSGYGCKQWLSAMWACRLTQRMNFDYETLRWQPKNCQMEEFEREKFLKRMRDKTIAFVGDSLGRQQFQSLMCMATGGQGRLDVMDVGKEYGLVKAHGAIRPDGWAYRFPETNTTILYYWSASLCDLEPINPKNHSTEYAMHLDRPPSFLQRFIPRFDVLVLNTGHHWNRGKLNANRWVMYVGGKRNTDRKIAEIGRAKNLTIHSIVKWVDSQLPKYPRLKAFYRSISPRHFVGGDWNTGGSCDNTNPMSIGKEVSQDESSDYSAWSAVRGTKVKLLSITGLSLVRDEGHISRFSIKGTPGVQDCLHWCLPGVPDTWNEILAAQV
ncbi:protein trichome birefringence-like 14 isoform X1 [Punica granatum]|uniref:Protein trichome birefringence-like 14 isoform X1 n=2 Tax=Punica granatum TaxID=22663 RepID=A0A6P8BRI2_PUNGR|nr:protein trichome birefringence-like 14 isoform X1 [Punica granatum]XP_031372745.1 protein trichome birefringence-like 14 isoform X1 [Punica granatum]